MSKTVHITRTLAALALGAAVLAAPLTASAQMRLQAPASPQPGECRSTPVTVFGPSAGAAQQIWSNTVSAQFGPKWSIWVGASNKAVHPTGAQGNNSWRAMGTPCYYEPVL